MEHIIAGPWVGEFGWELMSWQGAIRKLSESRSVIVCCPRGHGELYKDFAYRIIEHEINIHRPSCWQGTIIDHAAYDHLIVKLAALGKIIGPSGLIPIKDQKFIKYGAPDPALKNHFDVIIHARAPINDPKRSWAPENWEKLTEILIDHNIRMAAIGTQAYHPKITTDLRNIPLGETIDVMAGATMAIGPSSGPMHLASLCGTPHIVWTDDKFWLVAGMNNRTRYEKTWNPLGTPCKVLTANGWDPPVETVASFVLHGLKEWANRLKSNVIDEEYKRGSSK
jgi:hypothetical protein